MKSFKTFLEADEFQRQKQSKPQNRNSTQFADDKQQKMNDFLAGLQPKQDSPISKVEPQQNNQQRQEPRQLKGASAEQTRHAMRNVSMSDEAAKKLASIDWNEQDEISDDEAALRAGLRNDTRTPTEPKQPTTDLTVVTSTTIPAILQKGMSTTTELVPSWHQVKHLPGYMASAIRKIGRAVFSPFTTTPIEDIQVLASLNGQGPNTDNELNAVAGYVEKNGQRHTEAELLFHEKIPEYQADVKVYMADGITFFIVNDFAGKYIYSWPTKDGDGLDWPSDVARLSNERPRLGRDR